MEKRGLHCQLISASRQLPSTAQSSSLEIKLDSLDSLTTIFTGMITALFEAMLNIQDALRFFRWMN